MSQGVIIMCLVIAEWLYRQNPCISTLHPHSRKKTQTLLDLGYMRRAGLGPI